MTASTARNIITPPPARVAEVFRFTAGERRVFERRERLSTSQHAEKYRIVTNGPLLGKWRNEVTPYTVGPMDALDLPWVHHILLQWAPQTGKTQVAFNYLLKKLDQLPGPCLYVGPDEKVTKRIARKRIIPMLRSTPRIASLLGSRKDETTTLSVKLTNSADLAMAWATSAAEISSESEELLIRDETDKYVEFVGKEGDPFSLTDVRTNAFPYTKKIIDISTPTDESGYIGRAIEKDADEVRHYKAICPICGERQIMHFGQMAWPKNVHDPREIMRKHLASYQCCSCGMLWDDYMRNQAVRKALTEFIAGRAPDPWEAEHPVERPYAIGFILPAWYSPFVSLSESVAAYLKGLEDPAKLMAFITQHKAQVFKQTVTPKKESKILEHRTALPPLIVPPEAVALTAGIDVQKFGFWFVVRAWGEDLTSWLIQHGFLASFADVEKLIFNTSYQVLDSQKTMEIWRAAMDTGGGKTDDGEWTRTEEIYEWLRANGRGVVFGTKGSSRQMVQRIRTTSIDKFPHSNKPIIGGLELRLLDTDQFKSLIHWRLDRGGPILDEQGMKIGEKNESQRFYLHADTDQEYASQLLAEELRADRRGKKFWHRLRKANHYLDCEIEAAAAADSQWLPSLKMLAQYLKGEEMKTPPPGSPRPAGPARSNWMNRR